MLWVLAFLTIIIVSLFFFNKELIDGYGVGGWLVIIFIIGPIFSWLHDNEILTEFLIIGYILLWSWIFWDIGRD